MTISNEELAVKIAVLETQSSHLTKMMEDQNRILEKQQASIESLVALANKSNGALWVLMSIAAGFGAVISNLSGIFKFFLERG